MHTMQTRSKDEMDAHISRYKIKNEKNSFSFRLTIACNEDTIFKINK
jgi:hypothetical protein